MTSRLEREPINLSSPLCYGNFSHQGMQNGCVAKVLNSSCFFVVFFVVVCFVCLFVFFKYSVLNKLGEFSTGGPPCRTSKNIWHIGLKPRGHLTELGLYGGTPSPGLTPYSFIYHRYPFRIPSIHKWYPYVSQTQFRTPHIS